MFTLRFYSTDKRDEFTPNLDVLLVAFTAVFVLSGLVFTGSY